MNQPTATGRSSPQIVTPNRETTEPSTGSAQKQGGQQPAIDDSNRFNVRSDNPDQPVLYTKKGIPIRGEYVGGKFVRYKQDTTRPLGFTSEDWKAIPHKLRKEIAEALRGKDTKAPVADSGKSESPAMPVVPYSEDSKHREKIKDPKDAEWFAACVARSVGKREILSNAAAKASLDKEWNKLRRQGCWNEDMVREWADVVREVKEKGITYHVGRIFDICVEKNAELPEGHPNRKYKGRVVFQGNNAKDEDNNWAIFAELSSAPASMQSGKAVDLFGCLPGRSCEQSDGESAYTRAKLGGTPTWVRLPKERWPEHWKGLLRSSLSPRTCVVRTSRLRRLLGTTLRH